MNTTEVSNRHNTATLGTIREVAETLFEIPLILSKPFTFEAGQYVWLVIYDEKRSEIGRRAFSIASAPGDPLTISLITQKSASTFKQALFKKKSGEEVCVVGPFGSSFILPKDPKIPLTLFAGGVGVVPFLSIIRQTQNETVPRKIQLFYTDDTAARLLDEKQFWLQKKRSKNVTITQTTKRIGARDLESLTEISRGYCYVSGPQGFVDTTNQLLLEKGVLPSQIIFEAIYPSKKTDSELQHLFKDGRLMHADDVSSSLTRQVNLLVRLLEYSPNHIIVTNPHGMILYANKAAQLMTGFSVDEMIGNTPRLWGGLMSPSFYKAMWKNKLFGESVRDKIVNRKKDGTLYYVYSNMTSITNESGAVLGWIATEEDVSELELNQRKLLEKGAELEKSERALMNVLEDLEDEKTRMQVSHAKNSAILSSIGDGVVAVDKDGIILLVNKAFELLVGWSEVEVVGQPIFKILPQEDETGERVPNAKRAVMSALVGTRTDAISNTDGNSHHRYYYYVRKDGTRFPAAFVVTPIMLGKEKLGAVMVFRNTEKERALETAKSEFVSIASHQLRTPLTGIRWVSEYLLKKLKLPKKSTEYLQDIHTSTARLSELLDILLNLSRIEEGAIGIAPQPLEVVNYVHDYLDECRPLIDKKELSIEFSSNPQTVTAETDTSALRNIIQSIISNAIEYTPPKGRISVSIDKEEKKFKITVKDSGIGIPLAEQHKIFTKFTRASNAQKVKAAGTGLGAYIAKEATEMLGGTIHFTSKENEGTTFTITLPLRSVAKEGLKKFSNTQ